MIIDIIGSLGRCVYVREGRIGEYYPLEDGFPTTLRNVVREAEKGYIWGGRGNSSTIIRLSSKSIGRRKDRRI